MKQFLDFSFNGEYSKVHGVFNASNEDSLISEPFIAPRSVNQEFIKNRAKGYFQRLERSPLTFTLHLMSHEKWTRARLDSVSRWLDVEYFKEFFFVEQSDRRFMAMPNGEIEFVHDANDNGFIKVEMITNSPFVYSPYYSTGYYNYTSNTSLGSVIDFTNIGHFDLYPVIRMIKVNDGDIQIVNETDEGRIFEIFDLSDGEELFINNQTKEIITDIEGTYRYDNHNGRWFRLLEGENRLRVFGNLRVAFEYRFQYKPLV